MSLKNEDFSSTDPLIFNRRLSVAPMLDWTDRHARFFMRALSKNALLYSEMVVTSAILLGDSHRHLRYNSEELPLALQLGGSDPKALVQSAKMAEEYGYSEVNLNCGCPSDRVQSGRIGACLMNHKELVAECVAAMKAAVKIPVTVKTRLGIDYQDSWEFLADFVRTVDAAGVDHWIIHARKAWLKGLSPKENRDVPPLDYAKVLRLKSLLPSKGFSINGGIRSLDEVQILLQGTHPVYAEVQNQIISGTKLDGVMMGRGIYENLWILREVDQKIFGEKPTAEPQSQKEYLLSLEPYIAKQMEKGVPLHLMTKHILSLFAGQPGARKYRQIMGEQSCATAANISILKRAVGAISS
ncbi:MAG: tRNA dihydrouridine(20/20a) synthase DusA [Fibrobacter sp.]|nr:tRNA dihydrouridine(20/20a) synthase DusA [Fibrobacter sp.]